MNIVRYNSLTYLINNKTNGWWLEHTKYKGEEIILLNKTTEPLEYIMDFMDFIKSYKKRWFTNLQYLL